MVFAAALSFYSVTLAPTVTWGDSASFSLEALRGSLQWGGTAGEHPLFLFVGWMFSALPGEVARNINFEAAVFGALTVMLVYRAGRLLGTSRLAACVGAAALCVSHAFWLHSVIAEVYSSNAFFLVAFLNLLLEWRRRASWVWLAGAFVVFAIGLTNHLVLAAAAPGAVVFLLSTRGRALLTRQSLLIVSVPAAIVVAIVVAFAVVERGPAAAAFWKLWYGPPGISEYLVPDFAPGPIAREAGYYLAYLIYQFPSVSLLLGAAGVFALLRDRRPEALLLLLTMALNAAVFIHYTAWRSGSVGGAKFVFYITDYVLFSILCAVGTDDLLGRFANRQPAARRKILAGVILAAVALVPPMVYAAMPSVVTRTGVDLTHARSLPYRDNNRFFLNPNKRGEYGARLFAQQALQAVRPGAVIFADYTPYAVLRYLQVVEKTRPDVLLRSAAVGQAVPVRWILDDGRPRPTYLATLTPGYYNLDGLTGEYDLVPTGLIFEVRPGHAR